MGEVFFLLKKHFSSNHFSMTLLFFHGNYLVGEYWGGIIWWVSTGRYYLVGEYWEVLFGG